MIVVAIIAIIAAIAIPGLLRARISANEGSAIGTMRTLATSQAQYQSQCQTDQDSDGTGEFALLGELTGGTTRRSGSGLNGPAANPTFLTPALSPKAGQLGQKSGYYFTLYLAGPTVDNGITAPVSLTGSADAAVVNVQETKYRAYSWPVSSKTTGMRCFAIDQSAEVLAASNVSTTATAAFIYDGTTAMPYNAASETSVTEDDTNFAANFAIGVTMDTQKWAAAGS